MQQMPGSANKACDFRRAVATGDCLQLLRLLKDGSNVHSRDADGITVLMLAVMKKQALALQLLLEAGADPLESSEGETAIQLAERLEHRAMAEMLRSWAPVCVQPSKVQLQPLPESEQHRHILYEGGQATLYAVPTTKRTTVVLKVFRTTGSKGRQEVASSELQNYDSLVSLRHRNVVQFLGSDDTKLSVCMEFVDGRTLQTIIDNNGPLSVHDTRIYVRQLLHALAYIHNRQRRVIHRDIKPGNVMVTQQQVVKLIDFGFAAVIQSHQVMQGSHHSQDSCGTFAFMAPELLRPAGDGDEGVDDVVRYSTQSDMWAFGCTLYNIVTGTVPYSANTPRGYEKLICDGDVPQLPQEASLDLQQMYFSCMQNEPAVRPSATALMQHPFLADEMWQQDWCLKQQQYTEDLRTVLHECRDTLLGDWSQTTKEILQPLEETIQKISSSYKLETAAKVGTSVTAVAGGITAIVGAALLIPSFGAALPLFIGGSSVAVGSVVGRTTAKIAGSIVQSASYKEMQEKLQEQRERTDEILLKSFNDTIISVAEAATQRQQRGSPQCICHRRTRELLKQLKKFFKDMDNDIRESEKAEDERKRNEGFFHNLKEFFVKSKQKQQASADEMQGCKPVQQLLQQMVQQLEDTMQTVSPDDTVTQLVSTAAAEEFHQTLIRNVEFIRNLWSIFVYGLTAEVAATEHWLLHPETLTRGAVGGAGVAAEVLMASSRSVARVGLSIVGAAVFSVLDLGLMVYYSKELHELHQGEKDHEYVISLKAMKAGIEKQQMEVRRLAKFPLPDD